MIFVDTSYLIAVALQNDALHGLAIAWSASLQQPLLTTDFVLCELVNYLSRPVDRPRAYATLHWLRSRPEVQIEAASRALVEKGMTLHVARPDKEWTLTDCISFEVMREHDIRAALTSDHHFEQAGFEALLRRDPPG